MRLGESHCGNKEFPENVSEKRGSMLAAAETKEALRESQEP